jgi:hypothetical protein
MIRRGHGCKLVRLLPLAVRAYLSCRTQGEAAKLLGISPNTLSTWSRLPEFRAMVETVQGHQLRERIGSGSLLTPVSIPLTSAKRRVLNAVAG